MIYFATSLVFIYLFMIIFHKSEDNNFYKFSAIIGWLTILIMDIILIIKC
jgi:hypothetical protein